MRLGEEAPVQQAGCLDAGRPGRLLPRQQLLGDRQSVVVGQQAITRDIFTGQERLAEIGLRSDESPVTELQPQLVVRATTASPKEGRG